MSINRACTAYEQELSRDLNIWHLTAFGMNYILPFSPAIILGILAKESGKTVALPYLLACVVMLFTANSYIYMVKRNPVAGSLYSYVDSLLGRKIGFLAGWILFLDYILVPTVVAVSAVYYLQHYFPSVSYSVLLTGYVLITGAVNLFGIRLIANVGLVFLALAEIVLVSCFIMFGHHITQSHHSLLSADAFEFKSISALFTATTLAVLGYLGYDAISTLAEEAKNPLKDVPRAIIFSVIISTCTMFLSGYFAVLAMPNLAVHFDNLAWVNNAMYYIVYDAGGKLFSAMFTAGVLLSMAVFNVVSTAAGARLLYGMGRDRVIPRSIFAKVNKRFKTPHYNILLIIGIELIVGHLSSLDNIANIINFGAIAAFTILNFGVFYRLMSHYPNSTAHPFKKMITIMMPFLGVVSMLILIVLMQRITLIIGFAWVGLGVIYLLFNKMLRNQAEDINDVRDVTIAAPYIGDDLKTLKIWMDYDHWNTGDKLFEAILATDKSGFFLAKKNNDLIGSIVAYNYNEEVGYFGLYYIRSEYRGDGLGAFLTGAALSRWGTRAVACDALLMQVQKYKKIGFKPIYENRRFVFTPKQHDVKFFNSNIYPISDCKMDAIIDYDAKHFYVRREKLLKYWFERDKEFSFVYQEGQEIKGIIAITKSTETYRVGPFFANTPDIAEILLRAATVNLIGELVSMDMPLINKHSEAFIKKLGLLESGMKAVRMHKGSLTVNNIDSVYGHLSIELG